MPKSKRSQTKTPCRKGATSRKSRGSNSKRSPTNGIASSSTSPNPEFEIRRDPDHRYWITHNGHEREALGVTRTLVEANIVDDEFFTDLSRGRGKLVHFFTEQLALNTLGLVQVPDHVAGFLYGFRRALDKHCPEIHGAELTVANLPRLTAGTLDLDLAFLGGPSVWEVKTSNPTPWHGVQLAAYAFLRYGPKWLDVGRFGLYLTQSGGHRLKQYDDPGDLQTFFDALNTLHWRCKHGSYDRPYGRRVNVGYGDLAGDRHGTDYVPEYP